MLAIAVCGGDVARPTLGRDRDPSVARQTDIVRIEEIWTHCLDSYGGPFLFGDRPTVADAMHAPVCTRFRTYGVTVPELLDDYVDTVFGWPLMKEWIAAAAAEPDEIAELEVEF